MTNRIYNWLKARWTEKYDRARDIAKIAEWLMYISICLLLANSYCNVATEWPHWHKVMVINTYMLLLINLLLLYVGWLNFSSRSNKVAGEIDNAYGSGLASPKPREDYYDNNNVELGNTKFALNIYESCYFSKAILKEMAVPIILKNSFWLILILLAFALEKNGFIVTMLQFTLTFYLVRKLVVFSVVSIELTRIEDRFKVVFNSHKTKDDLDFQTILLNYSDYESAMVWLNTVLSREIYFKNNKKLTQQWKELQKSYVLKEELLK